MVKNVQIALSHMEKGDRRHLSIIHPHSINTSHSTGHVTPLVK